MNQTSQPFEDFLRTLEPEIVRKIKIQDLPDAKDLDIKLTEAELLADKMLGGER